MRSLVLCFFFGSVAGCSAEVIIEDDGGGGSLGRPSPPSCRERYDALGSAFAKCTNCHASYNTGAHRNAAPVGVDFDTFEGAKAHRVKIKHRIEDGTMPQPGYPQLTPTERDQLLEWTECGGPL